MDYNTKNLKQLFFIAGGFVGVLFAVFTLYVRFDYVTAIDFDSMVRIQDKIPRSIDQLLSIFSFLGSAEIIAIMLLFIALYNRKKRLFVSLIALSFVIGHAIELAIKNTMLHPGPPFLFHRTFNFLMFPSSYVHTNGSYPSGHSYRSVFIVTTVFFLVLFSKRIPLVIKIVILIMLIALLGIILMSRVSLGEHWISDVIGGALLGLSFSLLLFGFYKTKNS